MSNIPGLHFENIFLVLVSYVLILLINRKTDSKSAFLLVAILTFHHIVAYLYAFYLSRPANEGDPLDFLYLASDCTRFGYCGYVGEHLYANYLAKMLAIGHSIYFVFLLNILLFVISLYYFVGISEFFSMKANRRMTIFIYGMWPSVVYFTTLNYREPFELYLLIIAVYFGLTGSKYDSFIRMLASMFLLLAMGLFHIKGLIFLSPVLFIILVSYKLPLSLLSLSKKVILLMTMSLVVYYSQIAFLEYRQEIHYKKAQAQVLKNKLSDNESRAGEMKERVLSDSDLLFEANKNIYLKEKNYSKKDPDYIDQFMRKVTFYRASLTWVRQPQTAFFTTISDHSIPAFIATYFLAYMEYLIAPFILQVKSIPGVLAYAESLLRVLLFVSSLILLKRFPQARILFIIYLAITAMWAIGVVSYGAAIRHHVQTNWILVLLGVPLISEFLSRKFR